MATLLAYLSCALLLVSAACAVPVSALASTNGQTGSDPASPSIVDCPVGWTFAGPEGYSGLFIHNNSGAIQSIAGYPNSNVWFVGSVNGGVWRTRDITAPSPHWEPVTDGQDVSCSSIAALRVSPFDANLVLAGCGGSTSSEMGPDWNVLNNGDWAGMMISRDGGDTWTMTSFPPNFFISSIAFTGPGTMVAAARSNFFDRNDGGIWVSSDNGQSWDRMFNKPVFDLLFDLKSKQLFAVLALAADTVYVSGDLGYTWKQDSGGMNWGSYVPYYARLSLSTATDQPVMFLGAFLLNPKNHSDTTSALVYSPIVAGQPLKWQVVTGQPFDLDPDHMPKDRIAVLADPELASIVYVAGNAGVSAGDCVDGSCTDVYRVDWTKGVWELMVGPHDTSDNSDPHPDCREFAWDYVNGNLLLTSDGGLSVRSQPRTHTGTWKGLAGDMHVMEYYTAFWDSRLERFVAGAQDNFVQITPPASSKSLRSQGFLGCDGTRTQVDNMHCPSRMFGGCQFLDGFTMWSDFPIKSEPLNLHKAFPLATDLPYFVSAFTLLTTDPGQLVVWVNGTTDRPSAFYQLEVPSQGAPVPAYTHLVDVPGNGGIYDVVAGGYTDGKPNPAFLAAVNNSHVFVRTSDGPLSAFPLPARFADPLHWVSFLDNDTIPIVGPIAHGTTAFLAVSPANTSVMAVTGWPEDMNGGNEHVFFSDNGGRSWKDIIGNLVYSTHTMARARPSGTLIMEFSSEGFDAILVGTVNGVFITFTDPSVLGRWSRFGSMTDFPRVLTLGLSYEHYSDTLVASTFGRGVYVLKSARTAVLKHYQEQVQKSCAVATPPAPPSSARFFPPQQSC